MSRVETVEDPEDPRLIEYREIRDAERRRQSGTVIGARRGVVRRLLRTRPSTSPEPGAGVPECVAMRVTGHKTHSIGITS